MSDFAGIGTKRIELGGSKWIEAKEELTYGEDKILQGYAAKGLGASGEDYGPEYERWFVKRLATWIVDWSMKDGDGRTMPVTEASIRALKPAVAQRIDVAVSKHIEEYLKNSQSDTETAT